MTKPIGELINQQFKLRENKATLVSKLKDIEQEMADVEQRIIATMDVIGTDTARTELATATKSKRSRWNISDYERLTQWVLEAPEERIYLFERRLGQAAVKELLEIGQEKIPGTEEFVKEVISLRKR